MRNSSVNTKVREEKREEEVLPTLEQVILYTL